MRKKLLEKNFTDRDILQEFYRRKAAGHKSKSGYIRCLDFPAQNNILDSRNFRFKALQATRRAAKSTTEVMDHLEIMEQYPGSRSLYGGITLDSTTEICWDVFKEFDEKYKMRLKFNEQKKILRHPNGSRVRLFGIDASERQMRKILGQKLRKVSIDEAGSITQDVGKLCYQMIRPALIDLAPFSWLSLLGTCENIPGTFFEKVTNGSEKGAPWEVFKWSALDNPFLADKFQAEIDDILKSNPKNIEASWFKTHYLNEWCTDDDLLIISLANAVYREFNPQEYPNPVYTLGVDLGYNDASSFTISCYGSKHKKLALVKSFKSVAMDLTDVADMIHKLKTQYPICRFIVDGANKQGVEEMKNRHKLPLEIAEKTDKATYLRLLKDDVRTGVIEIDPNECKDLVDEWEKLIWKDEKREKEDDRCENHCSDSALYNWRSCYNYLWERRPVKPGIHTEERLLQWEKKQAVSMQEEANQLKRDAEDLGSLGMESEEGWDNDVGW